MFITYALENNKILKGSKIITLEEARKELGYNRLHRLKITKQIRVNPNKLIKNKKLFKVADDPKPLTDDELFEKYRYDYIIRLLPYHKILKLCIERKNPKYGYYNFITYIDSEDEFKDIVIKDIKIRLNENSKIKKKDQELLEDYDI